MSSIAIWLLHAFFFCFVIENGEAEDNGSKVQRLCVGVEERCTWLVGKECVFITLRRQDTFDSGSVAKTIGFDMMRCHYRYIGGERAPVRRKHSIS